MKRAIIKGVLLGVIFTLALMILSTVMNQGNTDMTTEMGEATYPVVSMFVDGHRVNSLHGYTDRHIRQGNLRDCFRGTKP